MLMTKSEEYLINLYLLDCEQRLSPKTVKNHKITLRCLKEFLGNVNIIYATKIDIRQFLNDLKNRKRAQSTIKTKLSSLKSFYRYLRTYHKIETVDLDDIEIMDYPKSRWEGFGTDAIDRNDVRALINAADSIRNTLIISIIYYCGLRAEEVTRIKLEDVDRVNRTISILGKGDKPRVVPYAKKLDHIITLWLKKERRSYVNTDESFFFPSKHGNQLTTSAVYRIIHRNAEKAGIQKTLGKRGDGSLIYRVHVHTLRHCFAQHCVEDNIPLNHIQEIMGHSNITTTLRYTGKKGVFNPYYQMFKGI